MPEIAVKKNTIYLNKVFQDWDRPSNLFYLSKNLVLASKDKERVATGEVMWYAPPETPFLVFLERVSLRVSLSHGRSFLRLLVSKRLLRRLCVLREQFK